MNTLQNTGTSLLLEQLEAVKPTWPVPLAWKHASAITQYGMYDFLIYYWTYRLPGTKLCHSKRQEENTMKTIYDRIMSHVTTSVEIISIFRKGTLHLFQWNLDRCSQQIFFQLHTRTVLPVYL